MCIRDRPKNASAETVVRMRSDIAVATVDASRVYLNEYIVISDSICTTSDILSLSTCANKSV